jgi:hypothetical protein
LKQEFYEGIISDNITLWIHKKLLNNNSILVLVKVSRAVTQCYSAYPHVAGMGSFLLKKGGCQVIIMKAWMCAIVCYLFRECQVSYMLIFWKELQKTRFFCQYNTSILFQWQSKVAALVDPSLHLFYLVFINCWTCSHPEYSWNTVRWMLRNNQLINL